MSIESSALDSIAASLRTLVAIVTVPCDGCDGTGHYTYTSGYGLTAPWPEKRWCERCNRTGRVARPELFQQAAGHVD